VSSQTPCRPAANHSGAAARLPLHVHPINARLASSCSRNGIRPRRQTRVCFGTRPYNGRAPLDFDEVAFTGRNLVDEEVTAAIDRGVGWQRRSSLPDRGQYHLLRSRTILDFWVGVSRKPNSLIRAYKLMALIKPMFAFGSSIGQIARSATDERRADPKPARSRTNRHGRAPTAPLVVSSAQRVCLVHELAELAWAEEIRMTPRALWIDQLLRRHGVGVDVEQRHASFDHTAR